MSSKKGKKTRIRLSNLRQARQFLSRLVNLRFNDEIDGDKARDLGYLCKIFIDCYQGDEVEKRIEELEKLIKERKVS